MFRLEDHIGGLLNIQTTRKREIISIRSFETSD